MAVAPPPGAGFTTWTVYVPAAAVSPLASWATREEELEKAVGRPVPFTSTTLAESKPLPLTLMAVVVVLPATRLGGVTPLITGLGFTTFSTTEFDMPPPGGVTFCAGGFKTAICSSPPAVTSEDWSVTVSCVLETNLVGRFAPFTVATDSLAKFVPTIVTFAPPAPAWTELGVIVEICGTGSAVGFTVKVTEFEVPPPGAGVKTVTVTV